jgi:Glycosyl hydrolase family 67 N-terminus
MRLRRISGWIAASFLLWTLPSWAAPQARPQVSVIVGAAAPELEQFAASELCAYLEKLFGIRTQPTHSLSTSAKTFILVGGPETNGAIAQAAARKPFPNVTDQGIVLQRTRLGRRPALIAGGGSPRATLWAVYELAERWGVRYLTDRDVLPEEAGPFKVPDLNVVMEPLLRVRAHPTIQDFASSGESWGIAHFRPLIDQLAKLKFTRMNVYPYGWQPYLHYELNGVKRKSAWLWYDYHYPITPDMPGRQLFGNAKEFWNPDLPLNASYEEFVQAGQRLVRALIDHAKQRGMNVAIGAPTTDFTPEFAPILKGAERNNLRTKLTIVPGAKTPVDDPQLEELALATLRATVTTYPGAEYVTVWMPEVRQWTGEYEQAWQALDAKYGINKIRTLDDVMAAAGKRKGSEVPLQRVLTEVKGDITSLYFYDRLLGGSKAGESFRRPDIKFMYWGVSEELFPIVNRILPRGWEIGVMPSNQPSHLLERIEILKDLPTENPGVLDLTLDDDNIGVVPQLTPNSLHQIVQVLKRNGWAGFAARERFPGDHDWPLTYLAKAAWDAGVNPDATGLDLMSAVCGKECADSLMTAFHEVESVTTYLGDSNMNFSKERRGTLMKYWRPGPVPTYLAAVRNGYRRALAAAERAREKATPGGRSYADFWVGRLEFAAGYADTVQGVHLGGAAEMTNDYRAALQHAETALGSLRGALEAYARVARTQTDRGAIAMLGEFGYRRLKGKVADLTELVEDSQ